MKDFIVWACWQSFLVALAAYLTGTIKASDWGLMTQFAFWALSVFGFASFLARVLTDDCECEL